MENTERKTEKLIINKDMTIGEILVLKPSTISTLMNIGMSCVGCPASHMETIEEAAYVHGVDVDSLVDALNK